MKKRVCTICKHLGIHHHEQQQLDTGYLYDGVRARSVKLNLCRSHAVELFRQGQKKFLISKRKILYDLVNSDEKDFIRILEKTVQKHAHQIY
jgi:hypothetical protein